MEPVLRLTSSSTSNVLTAVEIKEHIRRRLDFNADDQWLTRAARAALMRVEGDTGRQLVTAPYELDLYGFPPRRIRLPKAPLAAVSGITYVDTAGTPQTWASDQYLVGRPTGPRAGYGWIELAYDKVWPDARCHLASVVVQFTAGYGSTSEQIPADLMHAMLMLIGHWYENREAVAIGTISSAMQFGYEALVDNYRLEILPVML